MYRTCQSQRVMVACLFAILSQWMSGCATERFGRVPPVSTVERQSLTCREIELEIARTQEFLDSIANEGFDGGDVLGILGDFGIGNAMERDAATKSGRERLEELLELKMVRGCDEPLPEAAVAEPPPRPETVKLVLLDPADSARTGELLYQRILDRYPGLDPAWKRPSIVGVRSASPVMVLSIPESDWAGLDESKRRALADFASSTVERAKASPSDYFRSSPDMPSSQPMTKSLESMHAGSWMIEVGTVSEDGKSIDSTNVVRSGAGPDSSAG